MKTLFSAFTVNPIDLGDSVAALSRHRIRNREKNIFYCFCSKRNSRIAWGTFFRTKILLVDGCSWLTLSLDILRHLWSHWSLSEMVLIPPPPLNQCFQNCSPSPESPCRVKSLIPCVAFEPAVYWAVSLPGVLIIELKKYSNTKK